MLDSEYEANHSSHTLRMVYTGDKFDGVVKFLSYVSFNKTLHAFPRINQTFGGILNVDALSQSLPCLFTIRVLFGVKSCCNFNGTLIRITVVFKEKLKYRNCRMSDFQMIFVV